MDKKLVIKTSGFWGSSRWATPAIKVFKGNESFLYECWTNGDKTDFPDWLQDVAEFIDSWDDEDCDYE